MQADRGSESAGKMCVLRGNEVQKKKPKRFENYWTSLIVSFYR